MMQRSLVLVGGPDSGKTNYVGRLWLALDARKGALVAARQPDDIGYVLDTADHLLQGQFAPRTEHAERRDFEVVVARPEGEDETRVLIPDIKGELWRKAVLNSEIEPAWMDHLEASDGALLFVRVQSDQNIRPLDWVTSRRLLKVLAQDEERSSLPTQVLLCELLRFLELTLARRPDGELPRVSIVVTAWDLVDAGVAAAGPVAYLAKEYPLLAGRLKDCEGLAIKVFGLSVVGGDLAADPAYREAFLEAGIHENGWVVTESSGVWQRDADLTLPVSWVVGD